MAHVLEGLGFIAGPASEGVGEPSPTSAMSVPRVAPGYAALRRSDGPAAPLSVRRPLRRRFHPSASCECARLHGHSACLLTGTPRQLRVGIRAAILNAV